MPTLKPDDLIVNTLTALLHDVGNQYQVSRKTINRDVRVIKQRIRFESTAFATKTMPMLGKQIDTALKGGVFHTIAHFKRRNGSTLQCFLYWLMQRVFNDDGTLLGSPDIDAIRYLRQITFLFYKLEGDYPEDLVNECINQFVQVDSELQECSKVNFDQSAVLYEASLLMREIFQDFDSEDIIPRPGPGQTADKRPVDRRYEPKALYKRLHGKYPYYRYYYSGGSHLLDRVEQYRSLDKRSCSISRLAIVPKDSRGPRIICMEPSEYMWIQQGLGRKIASHLEKHYLTRGHVNFTSQDINGQLALQSSRHGKLATLDMKEASDRISKDLVELLFDEVPELRDRILALSTDCTELPDGTLIETNKYAPMGSAMCFPIMSIVHYTLMVATIMVETGVTAKQARKTTYVYGDDLICRTDHAACLLETLPLFGLRFNETKCCMTGMFRESCGVDAFNGVTITPLRIKKLRFSPKDPGALATQLAVFHGLFNRGLWRTARLWQGMIEDTWGKLPRCSKESSILGYVVPKSDVRRANIGRWVWDSHLQCIKLKARISFAQPFASMLGGWEQLVRSQVYSESESQVLMVRGRQKFRRSWIPISCA